MEQLVCNWPIISGSILPSAQTAAPLTYLAHYIGFLIPLFLGIFVWSRYRTVVQGKLFLCLSLLLAAWTAVDLYRVFSPDPGMILWSSSAVVLGSCLVAYIGYLFCHAFVLQHPIPRRIAIGLAAPLLVPLLLAHTPWFIAGFDFTNCSRGVITGLLMTYVHIYQVIIIAAHLYLLYYAERKIQRTHAPYRQLLVIPVMIVVLITLFSIGEFSTWGSYMSGIDSYIPVIVSVLLFVISYIVLFVAPGNKSESSRSNNHSVLNTRVLIPLLIIVTSSLFWVTDPDLLRNLVWVVCVIVFFVGFIIDRLVRRQVEFESALEQKNDELYELNRNKTEFLSFASHQMKAPLTSVKWGMNALNETKLDSDQTMIVNQVSVVANDMIRTVTDFLNSARLEDGRFQLLKKDMDIVACIQKVITTFRPACEMKSLEITTDYEASSIIIHADEVKIQQVIANLLDNAIKYTKSGSIAINVSQTSNHIIISIRDSGMGMSADQLANLFQKYNCSGVDGQGTGCNGIGLYLVKQIVEMHHGHIRAESDGTGKGSCFTVELPLN